MNHGFCPMCGGLLMPQSDRCRTCGFEIDSDYYPYPDEIDSSPDTWDDGVIPDDALDGEAGPEYV